MVVDERFDKGSMELVASMIGKEFKKYRCDPFIFNNMVYKIVSLFIGDEVYKLQNNANVQEYFGAAEDICNICITPVSIYLMRVHHWTMWRRLIFHLMRPLNR